MGIGDWVTAAVGSKNKAKVAAPQVDPNAYEYGGAKGGADEAAARYRYEAEQSQGRQGEQINYGQANWDRRLAQGARQQQGQMANMMEARARGQVPSIAQMQADRQMGQAASSQASMQASARGAGGMALAQQNAANNVASMQGNISGQAQVNAANERMQAEQAALGAYSTMRGQDLNSQQQTAGQAQAQAGINAAQRQANDAHSMGLTQAEMGVRSTQLGAQQNQQAQKSANALGAAGINAGVAGQNASMNQQNGMAAIGMVQSTAGAGAGALAKARGGPVAHGTPYLVGEEGPELIIPKQAGTVIPAEQTRQLIEGRAEGGPVQGLSPADVAISTWGTRGPDVQAQQNAANDAQVQGAVGQQLVQQANAVESPWERDARQVQTLRKLDPDMVSDTAPETNGISDVQRERRAKGVISQARREKSADQKEAGKAAPTEQKAANGKAPKPTLAGVLGSMGSDIQNRAASVDTSYHGSGGGFVPPQLIQARAFGGPIQGLTPLSGPGSGPGASVNIGGQGGMTGGDVKAALTGLGGGGIPGTVGGGGITGGAVKLGGVPGYEKGGVMPGGHPAVVGERGPEAVLPQVSPLAARVPVDLPPQPGVNRLSQAMERRKGMKPERDAIYTAAAYPEPEGKMGQMSNDGHMYLVDQPIGAKEETKWKPMAQIASDKKIKSTDEEQGSAAVKETVKARPRAAQPRMMTPEEMKRAADALGGEMRSEHEQRMANGPAVGRSDDGPSPWLAQYMISDARAKREAFQSGAQYATKQITGEEMAPWEAGDKEGGDDAPAPDPHKDYVAPDGPNTLPDPPSLTRNPTSTVYYRRSPKIHGSVFSAALEDSRKNGVLAPLDRALDPVHRALHPPKPPQRQMESFERGPSFEAADDRTAMSSDERTKDPIAGANRAQASSAYSYKPGFAEAAGQKRGEVNVGPMAQRMAKDPVARTAVEEDESGLLMLDKDKLSKLHSAGIASLQKQIDGLKKATLSSRMRRAK